MNTTLNCFSHLNYLCTSFAKLIILLYKKIIKENILCVDVVNTESQIYSLQL